MSVPHSWEDVRNCTCDSCKGLAEIYLRCKGTDPLFIQDCRMFSRGYVIANIQDVFVRPSAGPDFTELQPAIDYVLARQSNCDVFQSSWPKLVKVVNGIWDDQVRTDYLWKRERIA